MDVIYGRCNVNILINMGSIFKIVHMEFRKPIVRTLSLSLVLKICAPGTVHAHTHAAIQYSGVVGINKYIRCSSYTNML